MRCKNGVQGIPVRLVKLSWTQNQLTGEPIEWGDQLNVRSIYSDGGPVEWGPPVGANKDYVSFQFLKGQWIRFNFPKDNFILLKFPLKCFISDGMELIEQVLLEDSWLMVSLIFVRTFWINAFVW